MRTSFFSGASDPAAHRRVQRRARRARPNVGSASACIAHQSSRRSLAITDSCRLEEETKKAPTVTARACTAATVGRLCLIHRPPRRCGTFAPNPRTLRARALQAAVRCHRVGVLRCTTMGARCLCGANQPSRQAGRAASQAGGRSSSRAARTRSAACGSFQPRSIASLRRCLKAAPRSGRAPPSAALGTLDALALASCSCASSSCTRSARSCSKRAIATCSTGSSCASADRRSRRR